MCLIVFHWQPGQSLVLSANRDEFFSRHSAPLARWQDLPHIFAGRDLTQGGTWLGVSQNLRFGALTNVRTATAAPANPPSRGELICQFLSSDLTPEAWIKQLQPDAQQYAPFNLLIGCIDQLWYLSNYPKFNAFSVSAGIHSLSNAQLDIPWPKAQLAQNQLATWLQKPQDTPSLAQLLSQRETFTDEQLPSTGVPLALERLLSAQFILTPNYGTRCSTGLILSAHQAQLTELSWDQTGLESTRQQLLISRQ